jgi:carbonic anhydrase
MSCNATAPIDIPTSATSATINPIAITFNCVYDTNMCSGAALTISQDLSHASISCNGSSASTISFSGIQYVPTEIRIYAPSLHTYNGATSAAEMLIVHSPSANSANSTNGSTPGLIVSIPIQIASASSSANSDLTAIFQAMNGISASTIAINASAPINANINVNSFIPANSYYVYYGTLPYDSCGGNYYYAVFTTPIYAAGPLGNLMASNIATVPQSMKTNLQKSKSGPVTGVGSGGDSFLLYEVVGGDDEPCDASADYKAKEIGINVMCGILIAFVVMGIAWLFYKWVNPAGASAAPPSAAASTSGAPGTSAAASGGAG